MKILSASCFLFIASLIMGHPGAHASAAFDSHRGSRPVLASMAAGLPPIRKEDRQIGLPPAEREITKPPELEPKPIPAPKRGLPPAERGLSPVEEHRPGLPPPPAISPVIREKEDIKPGLPPKNR